MDFSYVLNDYQDARCTVKFKWIMFQKSIKLKKMSGLFTLLK